MSSAQVKTVKRRSITFPPTDPIQKVIMELEDLYENAIDLPSIIRISLIEHKMHKLSERKRTGSQNSYKPTRGEAKLIAEALDDETMSDQEAQDMFEKIGIKIN